MPRFLPPPSLPPPSPKKVVGYDVVRSIDGNIKKFMHNWLQQGWQLYGFPIIIHNSTEDVIYQAIVKYE